METTTTSAPPASLTAHLTQTSHTQTSHSSHQAPHSPPANLNLGREHVKWGHEIWDRLDRAVHHEMHRTRVAAKFLPHHKVDPHVTTVPAETVLANLNGTTPYAPPVKALVAGAPPPLLNIDEGAFIRLIEIWTEFSMTPAQVQEETKTHTAQKEQHAGHHEHHESPHDEHGGHGEHHDHGDHHHHHHKHHPSSTAVTLARRAANILSLAQDTVIFQGLNAFSAPNAVPPVPGSLLFSSQTVLNRGVPSDAGLLCIGGPNNLPASQVLAVQPLALPAGVAAGPAQYSENTVAQINAAYSLLSASGYAGPYVAVLHFYPYADSFAPLPSTLILPADRIKPLMEEGYYATSGLLGTPTPQNPQVAASMPNPPILPAGAKTQPQAVGLVISVGGNTVDLVNGLDPITAFSQVDATGNYTFRVLTRFALRIKDPGAIIRLEFQ
jgi:hypothetical protein